MTKLTVDEAKNLSEEDILKYQYLNGDPLVVTVLKQYEDKIRLKSILAEHIMRFESYGTRWFLYRD